MFFERTEKRFTREVSGFYLVVSANSNQQCVEYGGGGRGEAPWLLLQRAWSESHP